MDIKLVILKIEFNLIDCLNCVINKIVFKKYTKERGQSSDGTD